MKKIIFLTFILVYALSSCTPSIDDIPANIKQIDNIVTNTKPAKTTIKDWYGEYEYEEWQRCYKLYMRDDIIYTHTAGLKITISEYNTDSAVVKYSGYVFYIPTTNASVIDIPIQHVENIYDEYDDVDGRLVMRNGKLYYKIKVVQGCQDWGYEGFGIAIKSGQK